MPIATPDVYRDMLDRAREGGFAYPSINVTSSQTLNAALQGFAEAESDGIIQVSVGTALYLSGNRVQNRARGSKALALYAHEVAADYGVNVALHTDHCASENLDDWVRPLLRDSIERRSRGLEPLYQSHMWDGSALPLAQNLAVARELLDESVRANTLSRSRSASSAARRTASSTRSTTSCTAPSTTRARRSPPWGRERPVAT